jgi:hypothetical protein
MVSTTDRTGNRKINEKNITNQCVSGSIKTGNRVNNIHPAAKNPEDIDELSGTAFPEACTFFEKRETVVFGQCYHCLFMTGINLP